MAIDEKNTHLALRPLQVQTELFVVERQIERDGVEMGVLENGLPFLTESGLARMCGIDRKVLNRLAANWLEERHKPRGRAITQLLLQHGYEEDTLFLKSIHNGVQINAYTEPVCLALLEYYAFVADESRIEALNAFRSLARTTFRLFIYEAVGYSPEQRLIDSWRHFHDRIDMTLDSVPPGYFSVFREIASMIVPMIRSGLIISDKVIPDISVGRAWSSHWKEQNMSALYGDRKEYNHDYPPYYPQAKSNPQPSWCYPESALGEFRNWLRTNYILSKFPKYLLGQVKKGKLPQDSAQAAIEVFKHKALPK